MAGWGLPTNPWAKAAKAATKPKVPANMNFTGMGGGNYGQSVGYRSEGEKYLDEVMPQWRNSTGNQQAWAMKALYDAKAQSGQFPQFQLQTPLGPGGGGRGGGGGGGGAAGPQGLDQATLDWLFGQMGQGRPQQLTQTMLDLPDPSQYLGAFNAAPYDVARQGIQQGIEGIRGRGNQAFNTAQTELNQYRNPYGTGLQAINPDQYAAMERMAQANNATGALADVSNQGLQANQAFGNVQALLAANDQARQAANLRALGADRQMMETNLGLEGNMLNLGVNMGQARGQTAWDQMVRQAQLEAANQEAAQNWQRGNTVGDTNVANRNAWNQGLMQTLLSIIGARAPGTTLPTDTGGWYAAA